MAQAGPKPPHIPIRPDWLARHQEEILEPGLPIVDPHHHLWDKPGNRYFLFDFLKDAESGHDIRATVFAECDAMYRAGGDPAFRSLGETEFVNGIAAMSASGTYGPCRVAAGIVGHVDLRVGDRAQAVLEAHMAASGRFRGIRYGSVWHPDPAARGSTQTPPRGLLQDPGFREGFAALGRLGLSFDAWMYHTQLSELVDLARAFPETTIILDHVGGPLNIGPYEGRRDEVFREWQAGMMEVAASCPNVNVKIGAFGMRLFGFAFQDAPKPPTSQELAEAWGPYAWACIDAFGPERCMFESNFPVDKGTCSYAVMWNAFKRIASGCSEAERTALFSGTASRVYRIEMPS